MSNRIWIGMNARERKTLIDALASLRRTDRGNVRQIDALTVKLIHSPPHPAITVGVHGGQGQWTLGHPFPIRVCDYDGDHEDLPNVDERGQHCRIWFEQGSNVKSV